MLKFHQFENKYILLKKNNGKCIKGENVKLMEFVFSVCVCVAFCLWSSVNCCYCYWDLCFYPLVLFFSWRNFISNRIKFIWTKKKGKHNEPAFGPFNKAALHIIKGETFPFCPFCFLVLVLNLCVSAVLEHKNVSGLKKKKSFKLSNKCWSKFFLSICRHSFSGFYGCELLVDWSWISASHVYAEQQCLLVCFYLHILKRQRLRCVAASFAICLMSPFSLCCFDFCMNSNKTLAMSRRPACFNYHDFLN